MDEANGNRKIAEWRAMDTSETRPETQGRALADAVENSGEFPGNQRKRCRAGELHPACVADKAVAEGRAPPAES